MLLNQRFVFACYSLICNFIMPVRVGSGRAADDGLQLTFYTVMLLEVTKQLSSYPLVIA